MTIYIFDLDGTLTPPRKQMDSNMIQFLQKFLLKNPSYIVSGSDYNKIKEQVPINILNLFKGIFSSMGNVYHVNEELIYEFKLHPEAELINELNNFRYNTKYPGTLYNKYIEYREGMINFSIIGRDCSLECREAYNKWDCTNKEREGICNYLQNKFPKYDFFVGGEISIDIIPKGKCKSQVISYLRNMFPNELFVFVGDKINKGGNDYTIALACNSDKNANVIGVNNPEEVVKVLSEIAL